MDSSTYTVRSARGAPSRCTSAVPEAKPGEEEKVLKTAPEGNGELILVVDDETAVREITRQILECLWYQVVTAGDGTEALVQYVQRKGEIRVLIVDMMMPYMDGAATIRAIRKIDSKARIIATSGLMTNGYAKEARGLGVDAFLAKPHTAETLLQTLSRGAQQTCDRCLLISVPRLLRESPPVPRPRIGGYSL